MQISKFNNADIEPRPRLRFYGLLCVLSLLEYPVCYGGLKFTSGCDLNEIPLQIIDTLLHRPKLLLEITFTTLSTLEISCNCL